MPWSRAGREGAAEQPPPAGWREWAAVTLVLAVYLLPAFGHLTTYPAFYEDEPWVNLAVFEAGRGNGFSWAAFGEEAPSIAYTYNALARPLVAISPLPPAATVRALALLAGAATLVFCWRVASRLHAPAAWLAPLLLALSPAFFTTSRYARTDAAAQMFALLAVDCVLARRQLLAGLAAALAAACYPLSAWAAAFCLLFLAGRRRWRDIPALLLGLAAGLSWHAWSVLSNLEVVRHYGARYGVSASTRGGALTGILHSLAAEPARYAAFAGVSWQWVYGLDVLVLVGLAAWALWRCRGKRAWLLALVAAPLLLVAALYRIKNDYYVIFVLPSLAVVAAVGAGFVPRGVRRAGFVLLLLLIAGLHLRHMRRVTEPSHDAVTAELARHLPPGATVFAPNLYADLVAARPDVQFFNYHALSHGSDWRFPAGDAALGRVAELIRNDPRPTSAPQRLAWAQSAARRRVYFVGPDGDLLSYLRLIYVGLPESELRSLLPPERVRTEVISTAGDPPRPIPRLAVMRLDLDDSPDFAGRVSQGRGAGAATEMTSANESE